MGIILQKDRRSGITYAYESISYWDKEKHQSRAHRRLIGRVSESGEVVPTDGRCSRKPDAVKRTRRRARPRDAGSALILRRDVASGPDR